jgi:hypothetical protein
MRRGRMRRDLLRVGSEVEEFFWLGVSHGNTRVPSTPFGCRLALTMTGVDIGFSYVRVKLKDDQGQVVHKINEN